MQLNYIIYSKFKGNNQNFCRIHHPTEEHEARSESTDKGMFKMQSNGGSLELGLNSLSSDVGSTARVAECSAWSNINSINRWCIYPVFWVGHVIHTQHGAVGATSQVCVKVIRVTLWAAVRAEQILFRALPLRRVRCCENVFAFMLCNPNESLWMSSERYSGTCWLRGSYNETVKGYNYRIC